MELLKIWEIMIRRRRSIAVIFFGFFIAVVVFTKLVPPTYESTAIILAQKSTGATAVMTALGLVSTTLSNETFDADTGIAISLIEPILEAAIERMQLVDRRNKTMMAEKLIERSLMNKFSPQPFISVEQIEESMMLKIIASSRAPDQASKLANLMADLYIAKRIELDQKDFKTALTVVDARIGILQQDFHDALHAYREFMANIGAIDLDQEGQNLLGKIGLLKTQKEENLLDQEASVEEMKKVDRLLAKIEIETGKDVEQPDITQIRELKSALNSLLENAAALRVGNTEASSDYRKLIARMDTVRERIALEAGVIFTARGVDLSTFEKLTERLRDKIISLAVSKSKEKLIEQTLAEYETELQEIAERKAERQKYLAELSVREGLYKRILETQKQLSLAQQGMANVAHVLIQPAKPSEDPEFPITILNYILGIILGGFWAFGYAFLVEYVDDSIQSPTDLNNHWDLPFLGLLPEDALLGRKDNIEQISEGSSRLERLRTIRNRLMEAQGGGLPKCLSVTSTINAEGKSYLTSSLAMMFANYGLRVIAVDMNLRAPSLGDVFGQSNSTGLSSYISGSVPLKESIVSTNIDRLDLLPAGKASADPAPFLASPQLHELIEDLQRSYDIVLIDSPAIRDYEDAVSISGMVEAIIFVIAAGRTSASKAKEVIDRLQLGGRMIAGVVINRMDPLQYRRLR